MNSKNQGFSLIEIMIVVLIIGISTSMVMLYIDNSDDRLKSEAQRLLALAELAQDEAIINGQSLGLRVENNQYSFAKYLNGQWQPLAEKPFTTINLADDIHLKFIQTVDKIQNNTNNNDNEKDIDKDNNSLIYFLPDGEMSEFQIWISNNESEYVLSGDYSGTLKLNLN